MNAVYDKYSKGAFPFPEDNINPKKKTKEWARKVGEGMLSLHLKGQTSMPFKMSAEISELRALANGTQDVRKYQKVLLDETEEGDMEGYMNIDFDVLSLMPKFMRVVEGMMEQSEHQIIATAVDPKSSKEKDEMRFRMAFDMQFRDVLKEIEAGMNMEPNHSFLPESVDELELYSTMGGFKLAKETEIEEGLDYTFYLSDWKGIKMQLVRDMTTLNAICVKDYTDPYTGKVKVRYVDPASFVGQYSNSFDHRNMEWAGEIIQVTISDILKEDPSIDPEKLRGLVRHYNGVLGNPLLNDIDINASPCDDRGNFNCKWSGFYVNVLDYEWKSVDSEYWTTRRTQHGEDYLYKEEWGSVKNTEKKKTKVYNFHKIYKAKWIIGTEVVYNFGMQHDIPRPEGKEVALSYHFFKRKDKSIVMSAAPAIHQIALAHLKLQNALAMASPSGISVEFSSLQNMKLGGNKMEPLEILKIRRQTGDLIYKATTHKGQLNIPGGYRPIQELQGGLGQQLDEFIKIFDLYLNFIREVTGVNQVADASTPNPYQSVGGSELALAATNNALRPIYTAYIGVKEKVAKNISMRIQLLIKHNKKAYDGYVPVLGRVGVQIISVSADTVDANYYIKIEAKPTEERKMAIRQAATTALSPDRDGVIGIELGDFLVIERLLENGNLKYAEAFLNYRSTKNKERQQQLQKENMELNAKNQQEQEALKHENKLEEITHETDEKIRYAMALQELKEREMAQAHEREAEKIALQSTMKSIENKLSTSHEAPRRPQI